MAFALHLIDAFKSANADDATETRPQRVHVQREGQLVEHRRHLRRERVRGRRLPQLLRLRYRRSQRGIQRGAVVVVRIAVEKRYIILVEIRMKEPFTDSANCRCT